MQGWLFIQLTLKALDGNWNIIKRLTFAYLFQVRSTRTSIVIKALTSFLYPTVDILQLLLSNSQCLPNLYHTQKIEKHNIGEYWKSKHQAFWKRILNEHSNSTHLRASTTRSVDIENQTWRFLPRQKLSTIKPAICNENTTIQW